MKIDVSKMRHFWWEDEQGNVLQLENDRMPAEQEEEKYCFYHSEFPCELHHNISVYDYHPKGVQKLLIKLPIIGDKIKKKLAKHLGKYAHSVIHIVGEAIVFFRW